MKHINVHYTCKALKAQEIHSMHNHIFTIMSCSVINIELNCSYVFIMNFISDLSHHDQQLAADILAFSCTLNTKIVFKNTLEQPICTFITFVL